MTTLFYRNPRLTALAICLIVTAGLTAYFVLPRLEDPVLNNRFGIIKTRYPGATPSRVESMVTGKIENGLREIAEINVIESRSASESSIIQIELRDEVTNVNSVWSRIRDKLDDIQPQLPATAGKPRFEELETRAYAMIVGVSWSADGPPNDAILRRRARELADVLRSIPGTEKVELYGEPREEIVVEIAPAKLATLGLTVADVSRQIRMADAKVAAGKLRTVRHDLLLETANGLDTLDRVRGIPIRSGSAGDFVRLADIAVVRKTKMQPADDVTIINGRRGIALAAYVLADRRIDLWTNSTRQILDKHRASLPRGLKMEVIFDQSRYTKKRLSELMADLCLGAVAVVFVVLFMMGWRSAILVGISLPLSALMVFAGLQLFSIAIHQMSVMGLIIALGLLIDNAIVMVDEINRELQGGCRPAEAVRGSVRKLAPLLTGSTLTTILAFMPIALMNGPAGEFVDALAASVILALGSSLVVALTIIPAMTVFFRHRGPQSAQRRLLSNGFQCAGLRNAYHRCLTASYSHPWLAVALSLALPAAGFVGAMTLQEQFFPPSERDQFHIEIELSPQASLARTRAATRKAEQLLRKRASVQSVHWFLGRSAPSFFYNLMNTREFAPHYAQGMVQLNTEGSPQTLIRNLQRDLSRELPDARVLVRQLGQGPPFPAPVELRIYGPNLQGLRRIGRAARLELSRTPHVVGTRSELNDSVPKLGLTINADEAGIAGLKKAEVAGQLSATFDGAVGGSVLEDTEELPIRVRMTRRNVSALTQINVVGTKPSTGSNAVFVPLSSVSQWQLTSEIAVISRRNGRRVNTIQGYLAAGELPSEAVRSYQQRLEPLIHALPRGYSVEFGGEAAKRNDAIRNLLRSVALLSVLMMTTLVLSLRSFRMAAVIATVGAMSVGIGLLTLECYRLPFGFMAILGIMGLVGVAINDSIVVLAAIHNHPVARSGDLDAIREVVMTETRHVLATTMTTIAGFLPLLVDGGTFWPPLAIAIAGGVSGATLLAIVFVPSAYVIVTGGGQSRFAEIDPFEVRREFTADDQPRMTHEKADLETIAASPLS